MHAVMGAGRLIGGRYRLQEPIGRGAMGIVWRGRDELLARDVAVKEVQVTTQASPAEAEVIYQRTLREARTAGRLSHPGVVKVFDVVEEAGSPWIIMELVEARSLDRVITEEGPLPPDRAAELGTSLVGALAAAHGAGVLHRDVKPSNVLVTGEGRAVLTDFGIATFAEDLALTQAGMVVGTPGFTAPERIRGEIATPAADLWSLGATLYAAVEGRGPFDRVGGSSVISTGVANEDAPRAPSAGPLGPVIEALLSRDPGTRPDAATAERMLTEAATAARTGPRPLQDGWLAAEAGREPASSLDAPTDGALPIVADSGFLDPPDYEVLKIPAQQPEPATADSGERPLAACRRASRRRRRGRRTGGGRGRGRRAGGTRAGQRPGSFQRSRALGAGEEFRRGGWCRSWRPRRRVGRIRRPGRRVWRLRRAGRRYRAGPTLVAVVGAVAADAGGGRHRRAHRRRDRDLEHLPALRAGQRAGQHRPARYRRPGRPRQLRFGPAGQLRTRIAPRLDRAVGRGHVRHPQRQPDHAERRPPQDRAVGQAVWYPDDQRWQPRIAVGLTESVTDH